MAETTNQERLRRMLSGEILYDEPLAGYTSMGVGGKADAIFFPKTQEELCQALGRLTDAGIPYVALGKGTNLIVRDGGYRGVVISLKGLTHWTIEEGGEEKDGSVLVQAEAGVPLAELVSLSLREGLGGLEFCAGIPGTVGGALRMNAGAYGREVADVVERVNFIGNRGEQKSLERGELDFRYRSLALPPDSLILSAAFSLHRGERTKISARIEEILALRRDKHPLGYRNAGSIFKNPPEVSAGRIIEETGLKGLTAGEAQISEKHGNFIINLGKAQAGDVLALIETVKEKVRATRGIVLETEVHIIGDEG